MPRPAQSVHCLGRSARPASERRTPRAEARRRDRAGLSSSARRPRRPPCHGPAPRYSLALACALAPLLWHGVASAEGGDGVGWGPVIAITHHGTAALGWELALSKGGPGLKLNLGGTYLIAREKSEPASLHYIAWEPWIYAGATFGVAVPDAGAPRFMYGLWEAYAQGLHDDLWDHERLIWAASVAVGWRGFGTLQQFYIAPKLWYIRSFDFFS